MPNAVLVIDMIRGFLEEGFPLYCGDKARRIIPNIQLLLEKELKNGSTINVTIKKKPMTPAASIIA